MWNSILEYKARLEFWWAKKTLKDGKDFELVVDDNGLIVTLLRGKYKGIQYRYANMSMHISGTLDFSTVVVYNPENVDVTHPKFLRLTTNIIRIIFADMVEKESALQYREELTKVIDENRDTDISQSVEERGFYEESTPLLEKRVSKRKPRKKTVSADSESHSQVQQPAVKKRARARTTGKKGSNRK